MKLTLIFPAAASIILFSAEKNLDTVQSADASILRNSKAQNKASETMNETKYEDDVLFLLGLIEGWQMKDADETARRLGEEFFEPIRQAYPNVPSKQWKTLISEYGPRVASLCRRKGATVFIKHFSHEELRQLIQFYESPIGRKYARTYQN